MAQLEHYHLEHVGWLDFPPEDLVLSYLREGWFEYKERAFMTTFLRPDSVFIDVGAHVGTHAALASRIITPTGRLICIEPNSEVVPILKRNLRSRRITSEIIEAAIAPAEGEGAFELPDEKNASAFAHLDPDGVEGSITVRTRRFDNMVRELALSRIDLVKVDIEGSEFDFFESSGDILAKFRPTMIVEFAKSNLERYRRTTGELEAVIRKIGFQIASYDCETNSVQPANLEHPIWYENFILCWSLELTNQHLSKASHAKTRVALDIFNKGRPAEELLNARSQLQRERNITWRVSERLLEEAESIVAGRTPAGASPSIDPPGPLGSEVYQDLENNVGRLCAIADHTTNRLNAAQTDLQKKIQDLSQAAMEIDALGNELQLARHRCEELRTAESELTELRQRLIESDASLEATSNELKTRTNDLRTALERLHKAQDSNNELNEFVKARELEVARLRRQTADLLHQRDAATRSAHEAQSELRQLELSIAEVRRQAEDANRRHAELIVEVTARIMELRSGRWLRVAHSLNLQSSRRLIDLLNLVSS